MYFDLTRKAKLLVADYINKKNEDIHEITPITLGEININWFSKTVNNWSAFLSTNIPDGVYYEVGYNGFTNSSYLYAYQKFDSVSIDETERN